MTEREPDPIEDLLKPPYDESRIAATWNRIAHARQHPRTRSARRWVLAGACVAIAVMVAWPRSSRIRPLTSRDPGVSVAPGAVWMGRDVVLDDDSTIALASGARLQVLANEDARFTTLLEAGSAQFDVRPDGPRRWQIETGVATVEVVGTAFAVTLHQGLLEVEVARGVVMVHGERVPGRVVRLTAGQRIVVGEPLVSTSPVPPVTPAPAPTNAIPAVPPEPSPTITDTLRHPSREPQRPPPVVDRGAQSVATVVAEADRLASAGDPAGAAQLLERARAAGDPSSGLVSFSLGRLYLDVLGKPELAAAAFGEVIERANPRGLIEDAYARRVEALMRAHLRERAATAMTEYERAYPHGRRIASLRAMMSAP